jgi:hypothetical protein
MMLAVTSFERFQSLALIVTLLLLFWQMTSLRVQMKRSELQSVYDRYLEITKLEIEHGELHQMFMYDEMRKDLADLQPSDLKLRALAVLIFDQFAYIYNMSARPTLLAPLRRATDLLSRKRDLPRLPRRFLDRHRSIFEINREYILHVVRNPVLVRAWREWGLGETWMGSEFYRFVEQSLARDMRAKRPDPPNGKDSSGLP